MKTRMAFLALIGSALPATSILAQDSVEAGTVEFNENELEELYNSGAWTIQNAYGLDVQGGNGETVGQVEDFVLSTEGDVVAMIAEVGGFWDIGDTHVSIPWDEVEFTPGGPVSVPVTEENVEDYDLFNSADFSGADVDSNVAAGADDERLGGKLWRASELIDTYARVKGDDDTWANFGFVNDILIDDGQIEATVVNTTAAHGPTVYAYPYDRVRNDEDSAWWVPGDPTYDIPVLLSDASDQAQFDPDRMNNQ